MRKFCVILALVVCGCLGDAARADVFHLTTGESITGEVLPASANEQGVQIRVDEGNYQRIPWTSLSQDDLKKLSANPKLAALAEPFIDITPQERSQKTEITVKQPPRLARLPSSSFFGAIFSSGLGLFIAVMIYAANIYAGYEVAVFRAQPPGLVCGLSAVPFLGFVFPIVFLSMPTKLPRGSEEAAPEAAPAEGAPKPGAAAAAPGAAQPVAAGADGTNPMAVEGAEHPSGLRIAHTEAAPAAALPPSTTYQRGQFTFNRRFFETKFANFFGVVRRDADKDMVMAVKCVRGEYIGDRITRIAANDFHLQVTRGHATEEVMIPFVEIKEIRIQHKDAQA